MLARCAILQIRAELPPMLFPFWLPILLTLKPPVFNIYIKYNKNIEKMQGLFDKIKIVCYI
jgi:hypothetical protein